MIEMSYYGGPQCGALAVVRVAFKGVPECPDGGGDESMDYCTEHWRRLSRGLDEGSAANCGCVVLEVIDLTKADPGPSYADMLRSL